MTFALNQEQLELQDSLRSFFAEHLSSNYLRARVASPEDADPKFAAKLSALGLFELFAEGEAAGMRELGLLAQECGRALCPENIVEHLFLGAWLAGRLKTSQPGPSANLLDPAKRVSFARLRSATGQGYKFVAAPKSATHFLLAAETGANLVPNNARHVKFHARSCLDQTLKRGDLEILDAKGIELGSSAARLAELCDLVLRASELAGVCAKCVEMTAEYVKTRKQFDRAVGSFQAVQHKLADMHVRSESLRALADFACWSAEHSSDQLELAANSAIIYARAHAVSIAEGAIQLHGGIGFTWEYDLHLYLRRAKCIEALYSNQAQQREALLNQA